jgi:hypothetical protein
MFVPMEDESMRVRWNVLIVLFAMFAGGAYARAEGKFALRPDSCGPASDEGCSCAQDPFATDGSYTLLYDGQYYTPREIFSDMISCVKFMNTATETMGVCHN